MITTHNLGYPRIGAQRELKFALEAYWSGSSTLEALEAVGTQLRTRHWQDQADLGLAPVGDFSFYDQMLDMSVTLGHLPQRAHNPDLAILDRSFLIARGRTAAQAGAGEVVAGEMTKWFDTNYHYIVPEFNADSSFTLNSERLLEELAQASAQGINPKPVIIGPVTYLALGKSKDGSDRLEHLARLLPVYLELLETLADHGVTWVQIDEPVLVTTLDERWREAFVTAYRTLEASRCKLLLTTYFGQLLENRDLVASLPVAGIHIDVTQGRDDIEPLLQSLHQDTILSLGVICARNVWKTDLAATLEWLEPLAAQLQSRLWLAPSCSLLHVPTDLARETGLDPEIRSWLAFAKQKLQELRTLASALNDGQDTVATELAENAAAIVSRRLSSRVHNPSVQAAVDQISPQLGQRRSAYKQRTNLQATRLDLPSFPTTTIGSFPQTAEIRQIRLRYKKDEITWQAYEKAMQQAIKYAIREQEKLGLDVLVHGEAERNDMVEYFGEQLDGYVFSQHGWVQSYGSRCVKPPIIFGDIQRPQAMTLPWISYAQSLTDKPVKGMLTGPVTMLNWSFVRDDLPRSTVCKQLALAIRQEVLDLEAAGVQIIQIDEAALREGLPLRQSEWQAYLDWAVECFRIAANGVQDQTQIHTHMCYSEFNDIIESIAAMDADVITIETSRSDMDLLQAFDDFKYPNEIGPGVYDIHSPNMPQHDDIVRLLQKAALRIPSQRLWVNPDCGLKTRQWAEVIPALECMVAAAKTLRTSMAHETADKTAHEKQQSVAAQA